MRSYRVEHRTEYTYDDQVSASYGRAHLRLRSDLGQRCDSTEVVISPAPAEVRSHTDFFGNVSTYFAVVEPHTNLTVTAISDVTVRRQRPDVDALDALSWNHARDALPPAAHARDYLLPSPLVRRAREVDEYAETSFPPGRPLGTTLTELCERIYRDFTYKFGSTTVRTTLPELLRERKGVCQDFAHLAVGCLRSVGLAARYVSGYLETQPPPGQAKLKGADASHAWASVYVPSVGWVDLDPTNNQFADDRYVIVGVGRDYGDVPPLKGVIVTDASTSTMEVSVDVMRVG